MPIMLLLGFSGKQFFSKGLQVSSFFKRVAGKQFFSKGLFEKAYYSESRYIKHIRKRIEPEIEALIHLFSRSPVSIRSVSGSQSKFTSRDHISFDIVSHYQSFFGFYPEHLKREKKMGRIWFFCARSIRSHNKIEVIKNPDLVSLARA